VTKYLSSAPFSVPCSGDQQYRDNWDAIFAPKAEIQYDGVETTLEDGSLARFVVENYDEGEVAPSALKIAEAKPGENLGDILFTDEHEKLFSEFIESVNRPYDIVPLTEIEGSIQHDVREFHRVMGQPIGSSPSVPHDDRVRHRLRLIHEEFVELLTACGIEEPVVDGVGVYSDIFSAINDVRARNVDLIEVADALADIAYVVEGANLEFGIDSEAVLAEVQRSNMSKLDDNGKAIVNELGKVTKGPNYSPPDLKKVLKL